MAHHYTCKRKIKMWIAGVIGAFTILAFQGDAKAQSTPRWSSDSLSELSHGILGAASCATSSCHGGPRAGVSSEFSARGSEYPLWLEKDPHAASWRTMNSEKSLAILSKLGIWRDRKIVKPEAYQNCLACHNSDKDVGADNTTPRITEGVGCESCHGASKRWFDQHYQEESSRRHAVENLGLTDMESLVQRAKACTLCHVGGKDRDMNHDIIAAGHPALYFDMAAYHESYPKHWRDPQQNDPNFRSRLWLAGQIAMADSELELLAARADKKLPISTWPEFANYQCTSCHVSLDGIPRSPIQDTIVTGRAPIREWNLRGVENLSNYLNLQESDLLEASKTLKSRMEAANPNAEAIAANSNELQRMLRILSNRDESLLLWSRERQLQLSAQKLLNDRKNSNWEYAAGTYLSAWATLSNKRNVVLDGNMNTIRNALLFPAGSQTPQFPRNSKTAPPNTPPDLEQWKTALENASSIILKNGQK